MMVGQEHEEQEGFNGRFNLVDKVGDENGSDETAIVVLFGRRRLLHLHGSRQQLLNLFELMNGYYMCGY